MFVWTVGVRDGRQVIIVVNIDRVVTSYRRVRRGRWKRSRWGDFFCCHYALNESVTVGNAVFLWDLLVAWKIGKGWIE